MSRLPLTRLFLLPLALAAAETGCVAHNVWGLTRHWYEYEQTLYLAMKEPGEKNYQEHLASIQSLLAACDEKGWKPAPGIHVEYALYAAKLGRMEEVELHLSKEVEVYPESAAFVAALRNTLLGKPLQKPPAPSGQADQADSGERRGEAR